MSVTIRELIKAIREGTLAIENDCETMGTLVQCLKYCFPEDDSEIAIKYSKDHFQFFFACPDCHEEFDCWNATELPTITASELWKHIEGEAERARIEAEIRSKGECLVSRYAEIDKIMDELRSSKLGDGGCDYNPCCNPEPTLQQLHQRIKIIGEQQLDLMHWIEQLEDKIEAKKCCKK